MQTRFAARLSLFQGLCKAVPVLLWAFWLRPLWALQPSAAPANMDAVRQAWTLLGWEDYKQARRWFERATESRDAVTAYYGWEGIADCAAALDEDPREVMRRYLKARDFAESKVLDAGIVRRARERLWRYQERFIHRAAPGKAWQGSAGRQALLSIAEGYGDAGPALRLAAWECLGDRAFAGRRSRNAVEAAVHAWRQALNQSPNKIERVRLEAKLAEGEALLPGGRRGAGADDVELAGGRVDPGLLELLGRCGKCAGRGKQQRRACAEVAQAYTDFYGPGAKRPQPAKLRNTVERLRRSLTDSACY